MKQFMKHLMKIKSFAALIFAGLVCAYMATGYLYSLIFHDNFDYTIPFVFLIQGLALSAAISTLWHLIVSDKIIKKMRWFLRLIIFSALLFVFLAGCLLTFFWIPTNWAKLWLLVAGAVSGGIIALSVIGEIYFKSTGKRYTEMLNDYKSSDKHSINL
ncbi:MAG: hypothetical protein FWE86_05365 [Oscillospiraceae bacterium]|nr:hypothetical protein [Oscillospiraceae bacterium]